MLLGLTGAHRTGKTTLAKAYAETAGVPFIETSTAALWAELGLDPTADMPFSRRLEVQIRILDRLEDTYRKACDEHFDGGLTMPVIDRTPYDALAYLMADVTRATEVNEAAFARYCQRVNYLTQKYFSGVMLIQPGIASAWEPGKGPMNAAYMEHLNTLLTGVMAKRDVPVPVCVLRRDVTDLDERVAMLGKFAAMLGDLDVAVAKTAPLH